ncbi:MAG: methyl-accepting chemotaxis protein [Candidatus Omnitrophica bacterium]|nr:methyl-accepting chemotaxis protein [Candidatus Omnitrophota bacterium]
MGSTPHRRKNYFIKKRFQANFFLRFAALLLFEALLILGLFLVVSKGSLTAAYHENTFTLARTGKFFFKELAAVILMTGIAAAAAASLVFMFLSHRIGGALYRFEKTLRQAREGDLSVRASLRKTDELHDLNIELNAFLDATEARIAEIRGEVEQAAGTSEPTGKTLARARQLLAWFKTAK